MWHAGRMLCPPPGEWCGGDPPFFENTLAEWLATAETALPPVMFDVSGTPNVFGRDRVSYHLFSSLITVGWRPPEGGKIDILAPPESGYFRCHAAPYTSGQGGCTFDAVLGVFTLNWL